MQPRDLPWIVLLAIVLPHFAWAADKAEKQQEATALLANAAALSNIRSSGSTPFHLHLLVTTTHITSKSLEGVYDEVWDAPDKWRREITFPDFRQLEVGDKDARWLDRNLDFRPHAAYLLALLVHSVTPPGLLPEEEVVKLHNQKKSGDETRCVQLKRSGWDRTLCFNSMGLLSSRTSVEYRFEYLDYRKFQDREFPHTMRAYEDGHQVLEVRVGDFAALSSVDATQFNPPATARPMALCEPLEQDKPAKNVQPEYPPTAAQSLRQGVVTLYALLSSDGSVQRVKVLQSAGSLLDEASVNAVRQWIYSPAKCGAAPLPREKEITVRFTIRVP